MSMPGRTLSSLADIDGLRALAVIAVVLFHLDLPYFHGGFLGVDIFFVVSGFLITGLIEDKLAAETFRFRDFYARRVRRLFPAIYMTVAVTLLASWLLLQPSLLKGVAESAASAVLHGANILFFMEAGYWDVSSSLKPLLHLWSLGVEEQFYAGFALVVFGASIVARRIRSAAIPWAAVVLALAVNVGPESWPTIRHEVEGIASEPLSTLFEGEGDH